MTTADNLVFYDKNVPLFSLYESLLHENTGTIIGNGSLSAFIGFCTEWGTGCVTRSWKQNFIT